MPALIVIGAGKKGAPPPPPTRGGKKTAAPPPPPGSDDSTPGADPDQGNEPDADDQALSPEEVGYGENDLCQDCQNMGDDGSCTKYHFGVTPTGHCLNGYEPKGGEQQPDLQGVAA